MKDKNDLIMVLCIVGIVVLGVFVGSIFAYQHYQKVESERRYQETLQEAKVEKQARDEAKAEQKQIDAYLKRIDYFIEKTDNGETLTSAEWKEYLEISNYIDEMREKYGLE